MDDEQQYDAPDEKSVQSLLRYWRTEINLARKREESWRKDAMKVVDLYRGEAGDDKVEPGNSFNILYSNTETLKPSLYARTPTPDIRQRWSDQPMPVVKDAARVLERAITYTMDVYDFDAVMNGVVSDYVLPGRAVMRLRYEPEIEGETLGYQKVCFEAVNWQDYIHGPGRTRDEVEWEGFRHRLTQEQAVDMFGDAARNLKLDYVPEGIDEKKTDQADALKRATIWEIWDKRKREVLFITISDKPALLQRDDDEPLRLDQFFCTPRPLISVESTDDLTPIPEYMQYKSLARELEEVTKRLQAINKAIKVRGGYPGALQDDIQSILSSRENELTPMEAANQMMNSPGKLADMIWMWPIETMAAVQQQQYLRRQDIIQSIYELTGISDIVRGSSDPNETATAQSIKAQFGSQRLNKRQREVQRFARDAIRLGCEIIGAQFTPENLTAMTGIQVTDEIMQILRDDLTLSFVIDIETDSTIAEDLQLSQQRSGEFAQGMGSFLQAVMPLVQQQALPAEAAMEMVKGFAQGFKMPRAVSDALDQMGQQPPQQQPSEAQVKAQVEGQKLQADQAIKQGEQQLALRRQEFDERMAFEDLNIRRQQAGMEEQKYNSEAYFRDREIGLQEGQIAQSRRQFELGRRDSALSTGLEGFEADPFEEEMKSIEAIIESNNQSQQQQTAMIAEALARLADSMQSLAQAQMAPRELVRDQSGRPVGSRVMIEGTVN